MNYIFIIFLGLGFLISMMQGFTIGAAAASAMHQIYGALWYVVAAVCLSGAGIISVISIKPNAADGVERDRFKFEAEQHLLPPQKPE